jgi:hypothetical protein
VCPLTLAPGVLLTDHQITADAAKPPSAGSAPRRIVRRVASVLLIVVACVLAPLSVVTVWIHDIALDTDRYVSTMAPLATNPAIQDAVVKRITQAVGVRVDGPQIAGEIADWLKSRGLPARAAGAVGQLGPQLDSAVDGAVDKVATQFVTSNAFATVWTQANRSAHSAVVHALTGKGRGAIGVANGTVTLDVGTAVDTVKNQLVQAGLAPASKIPQVDKQVVLFQSDQLAKAQKGARLLGVVGNWLPVLAVLIAAAGIMLARRRRRALARTALGAAAGCLVVSLVLVVARHYYLDHLPAQVQSPAAAAAVFDTLLRFLRVALRTVLVLGVVVALGAYLVGPGALPRLLRTDCERGADAAARWTHARGLGTGAVGTVTARYRHWFTVGAVLAVSVAFALWDHPTVLTVVSLVLVLLAVLLVVALLAADGRATGGAHGGETGNAPGDVRQGR